MGLVGRHPKVLRSLRREGSGRRTSATGEVGRVFRGAGFEVVWVYKRGEKIDSNWFSLRVVDLLAVVRGRLRVEFADRHTRSRILGVGDVLVLPPQTRCRAYRWPRDSRGPTVFLAIYPISRSGSSSRRTHERSH